MSKSTVRNIFIFILIFLPLQYIAVGIVGFYHSEPWPAFVFPGFKNVYDTEGQYQIRDTRFELYNQQNEKLTSVSPHQIFEGIPRSQMGGFLRSRFHNPNTIQSFSNLAKDYLRKNSTLLAKKM